MNKFLPMKNEVNIMSERSNILGKLLYAKISQEWKHFECSLKKAEVAEEQMLLYVLWVLDELKSEERDDYKELWSDVRHELRRNFLGNNFTFNNDDLDFITNLVLAFALHLFGLLLSGNMNRCEQYSHIVNGLNGLWHKVNELMKKMQPATSHELREYIRYYFDSDLFYTKSEAMAWAEDMEELSEHRNKKMQIVYANKVNITDSKIKEFYEKGNG